MNVSNLISTLQRHVELNPHYADCVINDSNGAEIEGLGFGSGIRVISDYRAEISERSSWDSFNAVFQLAGIKVLAYWEIVNQYAGKSYPGRTLEEPWWLVKTECGLIQIGWRKRVINIDWSDTNVITVGNLITEDSVTKWEHGVHAPNKLKAAEYMTQFKLVADNQRQESNTVRLREGTSF